LLTRGTARAQPRSGACSAFYCTGLPSGHGRRAYRGSGQKAGGPPRKELAPEVSAGRKESMWHSSVERLLRNLGTVIDVDRLVAAAHAIAEGYRAEDKDQSQRQDAGPAEGHGKAFALGLIHDFVSSTSLWKLLDSLFIQGDWLALSVRFAHARH